MSEFSLADHQHMAKAITLAKQGQYTTTPNPNVGCVIVDKSGERVGQGWHQKAGTAHAEVHALREAGSRAKGATAYVTLEPCSHFGRTPPCAQALIDAGVTRVVAAMIDPNPNVSGNGLKMLEQQGIVTQFGLLEQSAKALNRGFIKRMQTGKPWVTIKLASSLDGKTALQNGLSQWITSPAARQDVQRHRAKSCAVLSGSGTVLADNPSLNVRYDELGLTESVLPLSALRQPLRVLLDGRNQLTPELKCLQSGKGRKQSDVLIINREPSVHMFAEHVQQWQAQANGNKLDLEAVFQHLGRLQLNEIWIEAGATLAGALLDNHQVDELILYQAPKLIGGAGQNLFNSRTVQSMQDITQLTWTDVRQVGVDIKLTALIEPNQ